MCAFLKILFNLLNCIRYCILLLILILYCVSLVTSTISFHEANIRVSNELQNDRPCNFLLDFNDTHLTTPEIIQKYGYPMERHWVTTEDGYILELHRIPQINMQKNSTSKLFYHQTWKSKRQDKETDEELKILKGAVFLIHGTFSTSRDFVVNCDRRALAFQLWENGYDVWMGNYRGNNYCRNHTSLKVDGLKFWDFSIDDVAYYDLPTMIDYTLKTTALKQLSLVGHSMGNAVTLAMLSTRPEYNEKINIFFAMSVAGYFENIASPPLRIIAAFPRTIEWLFTKYSHGELFTPRMKTFVYKYMPILCRREGEKINSYHGFCSTANFILDGYNPGQIPPKLYSVITGGYPSSTSVKLFVQWMQWILNNYITLYDYGPLNNLKQYGTVKPKPYSIDNLRTRTVIMYGENDWLVSASDVVKTKMITARSEHNPVEYFKIESPSWNHLSFLYGKDADIFVYFYILNRLKVVYQNVSHLTINTDNNNN